MYTGKVRARQLQEVHDTCVTIADAFTAHGDLGLAVVYQDRADEAERLLDEGYTQDDLNTSPETSLPRPSG
jgi:hypothetical protein